MKYKEELVEIFNTAINSCNLNLSDKNRKVSESEYFMAYLNFIDNSIYYVRFNRVSVVLYYTF